MEEQGEQEKQMASRFIEAIRGIVGSSEFETYYDRVQLSGGNGIPTIEEAKRDYQALLGAKASTMIS